MRGEVAIKPGQPRPPASRPVRADGRKRAAPRSPSRSSPRRRLVQRHDDLSAAARQAQAVVRPGGKSAAAASPSLAPRPPAGPVRSPRGGPGPSVALRPRQAAAQARPAPDHGAAGRAPAPPLPGRAPCERCSRPRAAPVKPCRGILRHKQQRPPAQPTRCIPLPSRPRRRPDPASDAPAVPEDSPPAGGAASAGGTALCILGPYATTAGRVNAPLCLACLYRGALSRSVLVQRRPGQAPSLSTNIPTRILFILPAHAECLPRLDWAAAHRAACVFGHRAGGSSVHHAVIATQALRGQPRAAAWAAFTLWSPCALTLRRW